MLNKNVGVREGLLYIVCHQYSLCVISINELVVCQAFLLYMLFSKIVQTLEIIGLSSIRRKTTAYLFLQLHLQLSCKQKHQNLNGLGLLSTCLHFLTLGRSSLSPWQKQLELYLLLVLTFQDVFWFQLCEKYKQ